jgi:hypothetical protein
MGEGSSFENRNTIQEYFESSLRLAGDYAGVFECDGETSYFYLDRADANGGQKIVRALNVELKASQLIDRQLTVVWSESQSTVFLKVDDEVVAALSSD